VDESNWLTAPRLKEWRSPDTLTQMLQSDNLEYKTLTKAALGLIAIFPD
jgi:hypothetical protein